MEDLPGEEPWWKLADYAVCKYQVTRGSQKDRVKNRTRRRLKGVLEGTFNSYRVEYSWKTFSKGIIWVSWRNCAGVRIWISW